jgi:tetratricopeptide (TPR) repeat protein
MSSVVDSHKERIFCLQNALKIDPQNPHAQLGLILLGAAEKDENHPFLPLARRKWLVPEEVRPVEVQAEKPPLSTRKRLALAVVAALLLMSVFIIGMGGRRVRSLGYLIGGQYTVTPQPGTARPTATLLPTSTSAVKTLTPTFTGPTPLWMILEATYTPTPLFVDTPHPISEAYRAGLRSFQRGELEYMLKFMEQAARDEPGSADILYYLGEAYRQMEEPEAALTAYDQAIQVEPNFAPAYLGRARVLRLIDPTANIIDDLDQAIESDPGFSEALLERAAYYLTMDGFEAALIDLQSASKWLADSPYLHLYLAQAYIGLDQQENGLAEAKLAYRLDRTLLPVYFVLGKAELQSGNPSEARRLLDIYTQFDDRTAEAWLLLGQACFELGGRSAQAIEAFDRALALQEDLFEAYLYRGLLYLDNGQVQPAVNDLFYAHKLDRSSFQAGLGLGRALLLSERFEESIAQISLSQGLAIDQKQLAEVYYWRAQAQEGLGARAVAAKDWQALLALPAQDVPASWVKRASARLATLTPTPTRTSTATLTPTRTITPTATLVKPSLTPTPFQPTSTPSPSPTASRQRE